MDSFSSPSSGSSPKFSADDLMEQLKVQFAQAYAEEFLETVRGKCFDKCITKPGSSLSGAFPGVWSVTLKPLVLLADPSLANTESSIVVETRSCGNSKKSA